MLISISAVWSDFHLEVIAEHNGSNYMLDSGDIVFSGDELKFSFYSNKNGVVEIFSGDDKRPIYSRQIEANKTYRFPENDKVLILDDTVGMEEFIFVQNGKTTK